MKRRLTIAPASDEEIDQSSLDVFGLLRRVFSYAKPHARKRNQLVALVIFRSAALPALAWAIGAIINGPIQSGNLTAILLATGGFAALAALVQFGFYFRIRHALELGEAVIHDIRNAVFEHLMRLPMSFYDRTKLGRIIGRMTSDLDAVRVGVQEIVFVSIVQVGNMIIAGALMLWCDWVLFSIMLAIVPVIWLLNRYFTRRITEDQRLGQESFSRVTATLAESVNGIRVTQGFVRQDVNADSFRELVADHSRYSLGAGNTSAIFLPLLELNSQFFIAMLLVVGGYRALDPDIARPVGDIVQFFFLSNLFFEPIKTLGSQYNNALTAMVGAERVFRLLDTKPEWTDAPDAKALPKIQGRVEFRNLSFGYDPSKPVLNAISFVAEPGRTVALVGHTGSGKTSIINLVAKMYLPTTGTLEIDGHDITRITSDSLHRQMAVVHQHSFLFDGTVLDNIRFARPDASVQMVIETARQLDCMDIIDALPKGLYTQVGEAGANLSTGQRQLVSFARALLADPRILILDEATSAIDALTESRIQRSLATLLQSRTSFVVAHRLSTIRQADLILVLDHGRIVERGTHTELLTLGEIYAGLHRHFTQSS